MIKLIHIKNKDADYHIDSLGRWQGEYKLYWDNMMFENSYFKNSQADGEIIEYHYYINCEFNIKIEE